MAVIPFSQALRERTWTSHGDSEGASFMKDLMSGEGTREDYIALVAQHFFMYEALESAAGKFASDPVAAAFISPQLTRMPALVADLEFLLGPDWRTKISALPSTQRYVDRINEVAAQNWAGGFIAHHYTRYMGDLSGGQAIGRLMQRHFGFETNGVGFYLFDQIASPKQFKETYRDQLDAVEWSDEERERVIDEVIVAYRFNTEVFIDLTAAKAAA
ncbi:heme oxygenase [Microbacteriaceae bacterium SG_E_30_P1]|uniref:Heme oxygenase n=1 Tax=Antiquaquibacter oligotrophicus TaxID=2880260 RepID=A0ABT6KRM3_9MICO|nr:biliverdin-producing heme oxygenase [Antiquaquibacter oligotrophicus]MDH6182440.1 heme oxygenase [Antiquaquibacter oligotrophicus]UDF14589.1 biliverdin-producing heme oxygenase [Antiquaquibacter oligotrophicus]